MTEENMEKFEENVEILNQLIDNKIADEDRKEAMMELFSRIGTDYMMAPASRRKSFHSSYMGGLFDHSLNVFMNLTTANKAFELGFTDQEMLTVALFHDIGKAVNPTLDSAHYMDAEPWKKKKLDQQFEPDYSAGFFTNRDRSMFVLQMFNIRLTPQEYQAILLNDGLMMEANRSYCLQEYPLAYWTQVCDHWATKQEKDADKS